MDAVQVFIDCGGSVKSIPPGMYVVRWLYLLALNKFVLARGNECDAFYTFCTADKWKHHPQKVESGGLLFSLLMLHIRDKSPLVHMA